ncbi:MAG: hypothetical protein IPG92_18090 [Flavobacteriales bacterium]|nr:hypothetical protein [Flavobacteriales bacterium]
MSEVTTERTLGPRVQDLLNDLLQRFDKRRQELMLLREPRRDRLMNGEVDHLPDTVHVRTTEWRVDPLPEALQERRVELLGGCTRSELINGLNAGAKSYIADLWNLTAGDAWSVVRAHRVLERAARLELAYLDPNEGRIRANPKSPTRLMVAPRPLHVLETSVLVADEPVPAALFDMAMLAVHCAPALIERQGGLYLYLRDVQGHLEARLWAQLFDELEQHLGMQRGSIRATVMIDSIAGALEADEILFELMHHAAGLSMDPQGYAADHISLFRGAEVPVFPDRETIGLNAPFLRALGLHTIGICHRRGCHAIGAPSFVLPPREVGRVKADYLEMLADKDRESTDGYDGTIVVHEDTVNPAMVEFNKNMARANQLFYQRNDGIKPVDLITRPEGSITVESLVSTIRTVLRVLVYRWQGNAWVVQGGRLHDRSSLRLALRLLWQWNHAKQGIITATKLDIHEDLLRYLVRKEADKMFTDGDARTKGLAAQAVSLTLDLVFAHEVPLEPQA